MRKLLEQRYSLRQNFLPLLGFSLFFYFSYHIISGERSYVRLLTLDRSIEKLSDQDTGLVGQRETLELKVRAMRPGSIDRDLLEERVRQVLGYVHPDDMIVLTHR